MLTKKQIKDIQPGDTNLELFFELYKKLEDKEDVLHVRICDETGVSDASFGALYKKYVEENQVYTAKFAEAVIINEHICIQLIKDKGSLTKEPGVLPFKDATFDLSKQEWVKCKTEGGNDVYQDKEEAAKAAKKQTTITKPPENQASFAVDNKGDKPRYNRSRNEDSKLYKKEQDEDLASTSYKKESWKDEKSYRKERFIARRTRFLGCRAGDIISFQAYVSEGNEIKRETKNGEKTFFECELTDDSGTLYASLYMRSRVNNNKYYDFDNMAVKVIDGNYRIMEVVDSQIRLNDNLKFKLVYHIIKP